MISKRVFLSCYFPTFNIFLMSSYFSYCYAIRSMYQSWSGHNSGNFLHLFTPANLNPVSVKFWVDHVNCKQLKDISVNIRFINIGKPLFLKKPLKILLHPFSILI